MRAFVARASVCLEVYCFAKKAAEQCGEAALRRVVKLIDASPQAWLGRAVTRADRSDSPLTTAKNGRARVARPSGFQLEMRSISS
jgi:hypothetical protein